MIQRVGEAIVLRVWPFHEADLLVSLFTREQGRVKGVARHAMRSRRRYSRGACRLNFRIPSKHKICAMASVDERVRGTAGRQVEG